MFMNVTKLFRMIMLVLLTFLVYVSGSLAQVSDDNVGSAPIPTRWMHPLQQQRSMHLVPSSEPLLLMQSAEKPIPPEVIPVPPVNRGRLCLIVEDALYESIALNLNRYSQDLRIKGYTVLIYRYVSGSPENIRAYLASLYNESASLVAAQLIGNIPNIVYEMMQDWGGGAGAEYEDFPCDLFYMDLDGTWSDSLNNASVQAGNGKYDTRGGNTALEIWVSRLKTNNLSALGSSASILNHYLDKNHEYRSGNLQPSPQALIYDDDDWISLGSNDLSIVSNIYGSGNATLISDAETTTAADYKANRLPLSQELILTRSHGYPNGHGYYRNSKTTFDYVFESDYRSILPPALFYELFICSGSDYTADNYLAGILTFNTGNSGLVSWGSTKTGGMWYESMFYSQLNAGNSFGKAFIAWYNSVEYLSYAPEWWYGMVLIGDASLCPSPRIASSGAVRVNIEPPAAVDGGAQWHLTSGADTTWKSGGETLYDVPTGNYTVEFNSIAGWNSPSPQAVSVVINTISETSGTYARESYTVDFLTDETTGASLTGEVVQTVEYGNDCSPVTANAPTGYHFLKWVKGETDYSTDNPLMVTGVTESMTFISVFAVNTYTVTFDLDGKGTRIGGGELLQTIAHGSSAVEPLVSADSGWIFEGWDMALDNITAPVTITAQYSEEPCIEVEAHVYLEGAAIDPEGAVSFSLPMRTTLNDMRILPGQAYYDLFQGTVYTPAGQPYNIAPWFYTGTEGDAHDSMGDTLNGDAGYLPGVVDWVLVSIRETADGSGGPVCQAAALLHQDGSLEFVNGTFNCCGAGLTGPYYLVIEHYNHLVVMSHEPVQIVDNKLVYDFRIQQSYVNDPFGFGAVGQQEILPGIFAMFGANGEQIDASEDTDTTVNDCGFWDLLNGIFGHYEPGDYNLNGDVNVNDRILWETNNGRFTSVPRD